MKILKINSPLFQLINTALLLAIILITPFMQTDLKTDNEHDSTIVEIMLDQEGESEKDKRNSNMEAFVITYDQNKVVMFRKTKKTCLLKFQFIAHNKPDVLTPPPKHNRV